MILCKNCQYFVRAKELHPAWNDPQIVCRCHRYAPRPGEKRGFWPEVSENDGCGDGLRVQLPAPRDYLRDADAT